MINTAVGVRGGGEEGDGVEEGGAVDAGASDMPAGDEDVTTRVGDGVAIDGGTVATDGIVDGAIDATGPAPGLWPSIMNATTRTNETAATPARANPSCRPRPFIDGIRLSADRSWARTASSGGVGPRVRSSWAA
jgi:hypothetical protein